VRVRSFEDLRRHLEEQRVVVDPARREEIIQSQLAPMAGTGLSDFGLLAEWKHLVEWPTVMFGRIPEAMFRRFVAALILVLGVAMLIPR